MAKDMNALVKAYRELRADIAQMESAHKDAVGELRGQLDEVSTELLNFCNEQNVNSIRTEEGTVSRRMQTRYWTTDWDQMHKFIAENDAYYLLEKRIQNNNMRNFLEENPDLHPAGLQVDAKYTVQVRKPTK